MTGPRRTAALASRQVRDKREARWSRSGWPASCARSATPPHQPPDSVGGAEESARVRPPKLAVPSRTSGLSGPHARALPPPGELYAGGLVLRPIPAILCAEPPRGRCFVRLAPRDRRQQLQPVATRRVASSRVRRNGGRRPGSYRSSWSRQSPLLGCSPGRRYTRAPRMPAVLEQADEPDFEVVEALYHQLHIVRGTIRDYQQSPNVCWKTLSIVDRTASDLLRVSRVMLKHVVLTSPRSTTASCLVHNRTLPPMRYSVIIGR